MHSKLLPVLFAFCFILSGCGTIFNTEPNRIYGGVRKDIKGLPLIPKEIKQSTNQKQYKDAILMGVFCPILFIIDIPLCFVGDTLCH